MGKRLAALSLPFLVVVAASVAAGCGDDGPSDPGNGGTDLSGVWTLASLDQPPAPACTPTEGCTGELTLTTTRYTVDIMTPGGNTQDTGDYTAENGAWTQVSDTQGLPNSVGTFSLSQDGNTLTVNVTSPVIVTTEWTKN